MGYPLSLGIPMGAEWLCILVFLGLVAGAVVVTVLLVSRRKASPGGFPVAPVLPVNGPGRFRVSGVERATGKDAVWHCEADSEANAHVKAELEGIIVTAVQRV